MIVVLAALQSAVLLSVTVEASEMHLNVQHNLA